MSHILWATRSEPKAEAKPACFIPAPLVAWLERRDTVLAELPLGIFALLISWRLMEVFQDQPAAPFISSVILNFNGGVWALLLAANGAATLGALAWGLWTGNTFRIRSYFSMIGAFVWSAVFVAALSAPAPFSIIASYLVMVFWAWGVAIVLWLRSHMNRHEKPQQEPQQDVTPAQGES